MNPTFRLLAFTLLFSIHQPAISAPAIEPLIGFEMGPNPNGAVAPMRPPLYLRGDGYFYGTSPAGGAFNKGTLMKMSKTGWFDSLSFSSGSLGQPGDVPMSSLAPSSDGWLWGTTSGGGALSVYGTIFRVKPETGEFQTMHNFASGFEGNSPSCGLVSDGQGNFWGVTRYTNNGTSTNGILFRINELTGVFTRVYSFPGTSTHPNGRVPQGSLYHDGAGNLWGTTSLGGTYGYGTVFKYNISAGTLTNVVHCSDRTVQAGAIKGSGAASALVPDGNGFLWGVTPYGGSSIGDGTVFKVEMATNTATSVLEFSNNGGTNKGQYPQGPLVNDGAGNLWGTANYGATSGEGSVFKISSATGILTTVLQFGSLTGVNASISNPWNGLTLDGEGNVWGIATVGGGAASWAAYKIRISDGAFTKVVEQAPGGVSYKGRYPLAGLAGNSTSPWLWGTTSEGGSNNLGTLFRYNPGTGEYNTVISFTGTTGTAPGSKPNGKLFVDSTGVVWGTTETGGAFGSPTGYGTIFKYDPATGGFTTVQSFNSGIRPKGALTGMTDGFIWGTTSSGLSGTVGTVFKINPATNAVTTVYTFASASSTTNGSEPVCGLVEDASGFVWGTTQRGGANSNSGMLFKIEIATGTFTPVRSFASNANLQTGNLVVDAAGSIYGSNATRVFKYVPGTSIYTDIFINEDIAIPLKSVTLGTLYKTSAGDIRFLGTEGTRDLAAPNNFYTSPRAVIHQVNTSTNAVTKLRVLAEGIVGPQTPADLPTVGGLYEHTDGSFYGITSANGTDDDLKPAGGGMIYRVSTGPVAMTQPYNSTSTTAFYTLVSGTTATLRGYANPNGNATTCEFEWGPTTELGNIVPANAPVGTGFTGGMCEAILTGLPANTTYFFRLRANSTGEPSYGPIRSIQTGTAVPATTPEISVESPIGQSLTDNVTTVNLGSLLVGQSVKQAVVARNLGSGAVGTYELTGITATVTGPNAGDFVITTPFDATQLPFNNLLSTGLLITFTPSGAGERTATLTITSNDANESSFEIPLSGTGLIQPEIEVDTPTPITLQSDEGPDAFGNSAVNAGTDRVFTIRNTGNAPLTNLNVTPAGIHASNFTITSQPPASIAAGASATFTATFTPSIAGLRTGSLLIASNDDDEDPFIINVSGTGIIAPEIQVLDDTVNLIDGASSINFGSLGINGSSTRVITIRNVGSSNLTGISLSFSGGDIGDFLFGPVAASVSAGQQITFNLTFYPLATGAKATTLRIASNDSNENPFDIELTGTSGIPTDPLAEFLTNAGVPEGLRGPNEDADNDGFDNLLEYALDLNPNGSGGAFTGTAPAVSSTTSQLQLTYRRVRGDVTYLVQTTTDPGTGPWTTAGVDQGAPAGDGTTIASIPLAAGKGFLRLAVTKNP
jgi:uncharacterized repeat protein (TIGR03803 family)